MAREETNKIEGINGKDNNKIKELEKFYENLKTKEVPCKEKTEKTGTTQPTEEVKKPADSVNLSEEAKMIQDFYKLSQIPGVNEILKNNNLTTPQFEKLLNENPREAVKKINEVLNAIKSGESQTKPTDNLPKEQKVASNPDDIKAHETLEDKRS